MSTLTLTLKAAPSELIDLSELIPSKIAGFSAADVARLKANASGSLEIGDLFDVAGSAGDTIVVAGSSSFLDMIGAGLDGGTVVIEGNVGNGVGQGMKSGRIDARGSVGQFLGSGLKAGLITVKGSAGDLAGAIRPGAKFGMLGGIVVVDGNVGARAGERMRRGAIIARGTFGPAAGSRMVGGTLWTEAGFGAGPGPLLRRGTLIGPKADSILPTYLDCGQHDLNVLKILSRYMAETLGPLAPKALPGKVRKYAGDMAGIGKGELLITA